MSHCDPLARAIMAKLKVGLSAQRIYQDLVEASDFTRFSGASHDRPSPIGFGAWDVQPRSSRAFLMSGSSVSTLPRDSGIAFECPPTTARSPKEFQKSVYDFQPGLSAVNVGTFVSPNRG
jgi:hypothetical protein